MDTLMFRREAGVLIGDVGGTVTLERLLAIRAAQCREWATALPVATVMDYSKAAFKLTPREWDFAFRAGVRWTYKPHCPTATVASDEQLDLFRAGVLSFAEHGLIQSAFSSLERALAWASGRREALTRLHHGQVGRRLESDGLPSTRRRSSTTSSRSGSLESSL